MWKEGPCERMIRMEGRASRKDDKGGSRGLVGG